MFDFSIVVPTFNRAPALRALLEGLTQLDYDKTRVQVLVVNDGGVTASAETKCFFADQLNLCWLDQPNQGPGAARNYGAQHARGRWLAFIDDDCVPERTWLRALAEVLEPKTLVGGAVLNGFPENIYAAASQCLFDFLYDYYHAAHGVISQRPFFTSNNLALARDLFECSGGFDPGMRFGEDREFCARLGGQGIAMRYAGNACVVHYRAMHARAFWKQHWQYGNGAFEYHQRIRAYQRDTLLPEPARFYFGMLRFPWRQARGAHALRLMCLVMLAQVANVFGFGSAAWRARRTATP